jgi:lauroyl/myristoyl acyltransferase
MRKYIGNLFNICTLRHLLYERTLRRIRTRQTEIGAILLPYAVGTRLLAWFCRQAWAKAIFFKRQIHLFREFAALIGCPSKAGTPEMISYSLVCNTWYQWRFLAMARHKPEQFDRWVTVIGLPTFEASFQKGKGVILVHMHTAVPSKITDLVLQHQGFCSPFQIRPPEAVWGTAQGPSKQGLATSNTMLFARQLYEGQQILAQGGVVDLAPDGGQGYSTGLTVPFHGRRRDFKVGFAQLALATEADVIPVSVSMDVKGYVTVEFLDPLGSGPTALSDQERIRRLTSAYVKLLEEKWASEPWNVRSGQMKLHLSARGKDGRDREQA